MKSTPFFKNQVLDYQALAKLWPQKSPCLKPGLQLPVHQCEKILVAHTTFSSIRTTVADGILRLNPHHLPAAVATLGYVGFLTLMVEVNHLRFVHVCPSAEVVVHVGFH